MNISQVAKLTDLTAKSIRLYEEKGLIVSPLRSESGYRTYTQRHVDDLLLIARCRRVGFSLDECKAMLTLANDPHRTRAAVRARAQEKLQEVSSKLAELTMIQQQLEEWIARCPGDEGSDCPIIEQLKGHCCSEGKK
ncbi:Cu(I)-responsive transcriptional regulator [Vibrio mimicus]|uniref:Cu(I)-responsive transcriptional regulator n=1 Tax=Vibrio mimicus TaxID=674 RepID=UPI0008787298|nr:Cu(I)-responsive transcriptional regulator [Vibrio mimicus]AOW83082.1 Cu(I)-responsive transcriptional regulator [Vibrio mimicus]TXY04147.1 Cu(I)-responsive transcriptional regulator [Vibrio mimicus]